MKPFLQQFARDAEAPPESDLMREYYFDPTDDMLHKKDHPEELPAVDIPEEIGPKTKKKRREKSDD